MSAAEKQRLITFRLHTFLIGVIILLLSFQTQAMTPLEEEELANVTGEGLAFAFDDFRFQMAGTSFFEHVGAEPQGDTVFNRGDLRWIGTTISSGAARSTDDGGTDDQRAYAFHQWDNLGGVVSSECSTVGNPLGCPIAIGGAQGYVEVNNPYVLRVREHVGVGYDKESSSWIAGFENSVVELVGATNSDPFRWAFWGEIDALSGTPSKNLPSIDAGDATRLGKLQNQEIILGAPVSRLNPNAGDGKDNIVGPVFQMYKNWSDDAYANDTLGMLYPHRLSGDYRFSVHQNGPGIVGDGGKNHGNAPWGTVPHFTDREGMYFMNVNTYLSLGQLHYQSMIVGGVGPNDPTGAPEGNFFLEQTRIPDDPTVYEDFYALPTGNTTGYVTGSQRWNRSDRYYSTHGYARWGEMFPETGGVSKKRYLGLDPDGPTRHLNTQVHCGSSMPGWGSWANGTNNSSSGGCYSMQDKNIGDVVFGAVEEGSDQLLLEEGGMVFLSAKDSTWSVKNNANASANNDLKMVRVREQGRWPLSSRYHLEVDDRYSRTAYNPELQVSGINLGSSRAEGMLIQHLKITSLGAAAP